MVIEIPLKLPSANDYIKACRTNKYEAAKMKRDAEEMIGFYLLDKKVPRFENPVIIHFLWIEKNKKRDLDNVAFAKKFVLDALVRFGILKDDNRRCVTAFRDDFAYGKENKVILTIEEQT
jgi:Holliday junction resolvase RusA-like endonuclease